MTEHYLDRLARTINENWDLPALTDFYLTEDGTAQDTSRGNHYTYGEMYAEILRLGELFAALGLQKGDHIAICGANSAHWVIAYLAIAAYKGVAVTILHSQSMDDIAHQIDFSDAKALFIDRKLWEEMQEQSLPQVKHVIGLENWRILRGEKTIIDNQKSLIVNRKACFDHGNPDALAMICFTSGSTEIAKGVMLSNQNVNNNVTQSYSLNPICSERQYLSFLPPSHMSGLIDVLSHLVLGKHLYVFTSTLSIENIVNAYKYLSPYMMVTIPQLLLALEKRDDFIRLLQSCCKLILMGGAKLHIEEEKKILQLNIPLSIIYGQTETGASISISPYKQHRISSCGKIVSGMIARIAPNGEILVKGENVMLGYYKDPEATARKIDADGWLHTGDKGHLDEDGYLYVEGRLEQDMIVLPNGENIHPEEIERKINALPEVKESIVLARDGKLVAIVVPQITNLQSPMTNTDLRRMILRNVNPLLPLYSQLYDVEITDTPLAKTEKQTIKRYLYK